MWKINDETFNYYKRNSLTLIKNTKILICTIQSVKSKMCVCVCVCVCIYIYMKINQNQEYNKTH